MSRRTKIIITIVALVLLIAAGVLVWYFFFREAPPAPDTGGEFPPPSEEVPVEEEGPVTLPEEAPKAFEPILRQLTKAPVAGAVLGAKGGVPVVRYMERANGNVHEIGADGEGEKRLTNTTIPKVSEALWSKSGAALIARYARDGGETIESFSARISPGSGGGEGELQGVFLPRGLTDAAIAPDGGSLIYLQEENGVAVGIRSDLLGSGKKKIWASPVREWLVSWPSPQKILLLSKPSVFASGMLLSLDPATGGTTLLLRNLPGLTALGSPARGDILYSQSSETGISLFLLDGATGRSKPAGVATFPEKCVWGKNGERLFCGVPKGIPQGSYPDVWYQGVIVFNDDVWSVAREGAAKLIIDLEAKRGLPIDVTSPQVSSDEKFLIFTDKESGTLWSLQLAP